MNSLATGSVIKQESNDESSSLDVSLVSIYSEAAKSRHEAYVEYIKNIRKPFATPTFKTRREKLKWLQEQRNVGVYVNCDNCNKLRYLPDVKDPLDLAEKWYCSDNPGNVS